MTPHNPTQEDQQAALTRQIDAWKLMHDYRKEEYVRRCNLIYGITIQMYVVYSGIGYLASRLERGDPWWLGGTVILAAAIALVGAWFVSDIQVELAGRDKKIREICEREVFQLSDASSGKAYEEVRELAEGRAKEGLAKAEYTRIRKVHWCLVYCSH
jgi:hypothetical protein